MVQSAVLLRILAALAQERRASTCRKVHHDGAGGDVSFLIAYPDSDGVRAALKGYSGNPVVCSSGASTMPSVRRPGHLGDDAVMDHPAAERHERLIGGVAVPVRRNSNLDCRVVANAEGAED